MKGLEKLLLTGFIILYSCYPVLSQQTMVYLEPDATFRTAMELFQKEKYAMAREKFSWVADQIPEKTSPLKARAEFLSALCGYELVNNNAIQPLEEFLFNHDVTTLQPLACLELGKMEYRKGNFHKAVQYFTRVRKADLEDYARDEFFFKLGYSYLKINENKQAEKTLLLIRDSSSLYFAPATYFRSHISYSNQEYNKAIEGFKKLSDDPTFKNIIPYYIAQIYYLQKEYEKLMLVAPGLLNTANIKRGPEIARMIGEAYYQNKKYKEAIPYLDNYFEKTKTHINRQDYYELAYAAYKTEQWEKAIDNFNKAVGASDSLTQNAFYHLGECYVKTNQKKFALNSFHSAYKEGFDFNMKEDALFNYAKLSYELSYNPYNEAIKALKQYISEYPESKRLDEAASYLVDLFISTNNYKDALVSLESIKNKDSRLKEAYQRLNYFRGIEEFNDNKIDEAATYFATSAAMNYDKSMQASAIYWLAECSYRRSDYSSAVENFKKFQTTPGAFSLPLYPVADYNIAYCYFKEKEYNKSVISFRKFFTNKDKVDSKILNDGYLRTGDCYFVLKNYDEAIQYYDLAIRLKKPDADYAMYQKALAQGAAGSFRDKSETLDNMLSSYPKSSLQPQARFELGLTYLNIQDENKALKSFDQLISKYPKSHYVKDAMLRTGLIYYNQDKNELALSTFKKVVGDYPGTPESKEALMSIRNIYVDINKVDDFFVYAKNLPFSNITDSEQDSITYLAAENQYMSKDCNSASLGFKNYLEKFSQGAFRAQAHFYLAECLFRNNQPDDALKSYLYVINEPKSRFTETSLLNTSSIYYSRKDYQKALTYFVQLKETAEIPGNLLTAQTGIMRCNFLLKNHEETLEACQQMIANENASTELLTEAHLTQAKAALELNRLPLAQTEFEKTYKLSRNEMGAEAKFNLAAILFNQDNYKEAEKMIFEFINEFPSHDYWLAKSFILLSDVYVKMGNIIQAKQTLQSIIDNYEGADLVELAHAKMNALLAAEKAEMLKKEADAKKAKEAEKEQETIKIEQEGL